MKPWEGQLEIIKSVRENRRTIVAGCIASSKTSAAAMCTYWWLGSHQPSRVFTIAPTFRQVDVNIWGEIRKMHNQARIPFGGELMPKSPELVLKHDWYAMGFATDRPDYVHGIHGDNDLIIVDEGQGVDKNIFEALENTMAGGNARLLVLCNPNVLGGEVYDAFHSKRGLYNCIRISAWDTPNVKSGKLDVPGMITREQVNEWIKVYGRDSNFVRVKVDAQFPTQESDTLIPIDWIEAAANRVAPEGVPVIGADIARFGDDSTVIQPMCGRKALKQIVKHGQDLMEICGMIAVVLRDTKARVVHVDEIGLGSGVVDRLREMKVPVMGVNVASKPRDEQNFSNLRSEIWWKTREALNPENPANISIPKDPDLMAELSSVKFKFDSAGRIQVEPKEKMKERLGRSPDRADALCLAVHAGNPGNKPISALSAHGLLNRKPDWA